MIVMETSIDLSETSISYLDAAWESSIEFCAIKKSFESESSIRGKLYGQASKKYIME